MSRNRVHPEHFERDRPDPHSIVTRQDFAFELRLARAQCNLSVRDVAKEAGVPTSTLGGYFAGQHLPALKPPDLMSRILRALGIDRAEEIEIWLEALRRVRRSSGREEFPSPLAAAYPAAVHAVSTRAPVERSRAQPTLRGRDELVARLARVVEGAPGPRVQVLHGLGGSGKSSVALAVADIALAQDISVFWLTATDSASTSAGMYALAARIGISADRLLRCSLTDTVWDRLSELSQRWLLVLDNADDPQESLAIPRRGLTDGTGWLRPIGPATGTIIVTTRDGDPVTWGVAPPTWLGLHRLDGLHRDSGSLVLTELAGPDAGSAEDAGDLSDRLGGHPMALMLAGRFLLESRAMPAQLGDDAEPRTYRGYLESLAHGGSTELFTADENGRPARGDEASISQSCHFSLDLLAGRGLVHARALLQLLACLGSVAIPCTELLRTDTLAKSTLFPALTTRSLWRTVYALESLGLVTKSAADRDQPEMLDLHPLARDIARMGARADRRLDEYLSVITQLIDAAVRGADVENPLSWGRWRRLAGHCTALIGLLELQQAETSATRSVITLAGRAAAYQRAAGQQAQAETAFAIALKGCAGRIDENDAARLEIEHNLARLYYDQGRYAEAEQLYRDVAAARHSTLGPEHHDTLTTRHYLARTLRQSRKLDEAAELARSTYAARSRLFGERNPDTLTARHGLADLERVRENFAAAADMYADIITLRSEVLGGEHPAVLTTRQYRAETLGELDRIDEAEAEMRSVWVTNHRVRGLDHPRTVVGGHALVDLLRNNGSADEAAELSAVVLAAGCRVFGDTHPTTLAIRYSDGLIRHDLGEIAAAHRQLLAVLRDREQVLGPQHPDTRRTRETVEAIRHRMDADPSDTDF
ncbi:tetratricopeptide repeat protein [Nocardia sp. NPDC005978]|uniref:tetratricopeptide repeat protein n=1 Tax=Nocardia sp. NPDC005978 TaxID=3156725 RepID=UPI0033B2877A